MAVTHQGGREEAFQPLTIFSFVWASQQTFQLAYFEEWFLNGNILGYVFLGLTLSVLLFPGSTLLFFAMLLGSIIYFVSEWPFVVNHIFIDTFLSTTIVLAVLLVLGGSLFTSKANDVEPRREIFDRFAPIATVMVILVYYVILVSKLNRGFFDPEVGCMFTMYANWQNEKPFLQTINEYVSPQFLFYTFMVIELILPILLTFSKTRLLGLYIGVPFHFVLGLMWHWAFSSFILALYVLIATPAIIELFKAIRDRVGQLALDGGFLLVRAAIVVAAAFPSWESRWGNTAKKVLSDFRSTTPCSCGWSGLASCVP